MQTPDHALLRRGLAERAAAVRVADLVPQDLGAIAWSGSPAHLETVAFNLVRAERGELNYLAVYVDGHPACKGCVDYTQVPGAGLITQVSTHAALEGLGLATLLVGELEARAHRRGITTIRLDVEPDNVRARRLYEHLGYRVTGSGQASWEAQRDDGSHYLHTTTVFEMTKHL